MVSIDHISFREGVRLHLKKVVKEKEQKQGKKNADPSPTSIMSKK